MTAPTVPWYDRKGQPLDDYAEIERLLCDPTYKILKRTEVGEASVSTVWLGLDHNWHLEGRPLIFETMIFGGDHADEQWRYATEAEAEAHHDALVDALRKGEPLPDEKDLTDG